MRCLASFDWETSWNDCRGPKRDAPRKFYGVDPKTAKRSCSLMFYWGPCWFEHQGKWWQIDCHHNASQGGGGISWAVCTKFSSWRDAPLLPPHPTIGSPVLPWFPIHVEEFIPSSLQYLSHVSLHHFPIRIPHIFSCGINYIFNYIIHHHTFILHTISI